MTDDSFLGNALNGIDTKNRVSIPAGFREALGLRGDARSLVIAPAERADCLVGYDQGYPAKVRAELETRFAGNFSPERDDRFRATFGAAERVPVDDTGRMILSATMKDAGDIDRMALFVGMGDYFEVWNPERFVAREGLDPRLVRIVQRLMAARGPA